ncbi:DUF1064 domain-containing protein [Psychrobacter sp. ER1]|uniref:DUF1064 domain-containing protein n=1 Tax=Psychrobacter TaxID=497 RepID=UPI00191883FB|nr:DUF1064 domain-containing protein [Psychrobacter nivimaris]|tara:strand:+ start:981 stop:1325 length:345 start_codon:yes stop_codon:yes gene_type:complete
MRKSIQALGRMKSGQMNGTEKAYAQHLELLKRAGEIAYYSFDNINLRLADNTFYKPDFLVMRSDGQLEIHEVKGQWTDDALVKIKVAADKFPFKFIAIMKQTKRNGGGWDIRDF